MNLVTRLRDLLTGHASAPADGAPAGLPDLGGHMLLTTYRRSGEGVATPVWNLPLPDGRIAMWTAAGTGKWKRMRRDPHVTIQKCDARGRTAPGSRPYDGTARILPPGEEADRIRGEIVRRHRHQVGLVKRIARLQGRLTADQTFGDTVVVITLADPV